MTHKFNFRSLFIATSSAILISACGSSGNGNVSEPQPTPEPPTTVEVDYQAMINDAVDAGIPGVVLSVTGTGLDTDFIGSAGFANIEEQEAMQTYSVMPNGSAGKKATALLVAMLHEEGLLNIDDTIDTWLPQSIYSRIENSQDITLRQLLNHSAGVHNYLDQDTQEAWYNAIISDPTSIKTDIYALQFSLDKPAYFAPGEGFAYSNTGYLLAGLIMDEVLQEHHSKAMRERVFIPLGLNDTYFNGIEKDLGNIVDGYTIFDDELVSTKQVYENIGVADAPLVSSATDISNLLKSIVASDSVVSEDVQNLITSSDSLVTVNSQIQYGLGVFKETSNGKTIYHHGGDEPGYKTETFYFEEDDIAITVLFNCNGYQLCSEQSNVLVQKVLHTVL